MKRTHVMWFFATVLVVVIVGWIASHTYWGDLKVPMPMRGEALSDPSYAAERFANTLGATARRDRFFQVPPQNAVIVLSGWHWSLVRERRERLERWVESGGRLVVDNLLVTNGDDFENWSGISHSYADVPKDSEKFDEERCRTFKVDGATTRLSVCGAATFGSFTTKAPILWALRDASGMQAVRVRVGRGTVTAINAAPFRYRELFDGDHGWLFVAATELRRGDEVHFVSEDNTAPLLALVWRWGAPVVVLGLLLVGLVLWRGVVRLGPLEAPARAERRSLAEQIRGTGQFALRHGAGEALHAATVRAFEETARRRVPAYAGLSTAERGGALERVSGVGVSELLSAAYNPGSQRPTQLRSSIAIIEAARRHILFKLTRSAYGTH